MNTAKNILITPGTLGSYTTSISQIDFKWFDSGIGTGIFFPHSSDLRATIYNWVNALEPSLLLGGVGTIGGQQYFVGPYSDYSDVFSGISTFPFIQFFPISGKIVTKQLKITGQLYDSNNNSGLANSVLVSTVTGVAWTFLQSGGGTGNGNILGSISTNQVAYGTGISQIQGSNNFWFDGTRVGIGTSSPTQSLHVQGNFVLIGELLDSFNNPGTIGQVLSSLGTGIGWTSLISSGSSGSGASLQQSFSNVGIVTVVHNFGAYPLVEVLDATKSIIIPSTITHISVNAFVVSFASLSTGIVLAGGGGSGNIGGSISTNQVVYGAGINSIIGSNGFWFDGTRVGIGTSSPTQSLHVSGTLRLTGALYDSNNVVGLANSVLVSTVNGIAWTSINLQGGSGSGASLQQSFSNVGIVTVVHNFGAYPLVEVLDANESIIIPSAITHTSVNAFVVSFASLSTGIVLAGGGGSGGTGNIGGSISTNQVAYGAGINSIIGSNNFWFDGINVGIGTSSPTQSLHVLHGFRLGGSLFDSFNSSGISGQILGSIGTGIGWTNAPSGHVLEQPFFNVGLVTVIHNFGTYPVVEVIDASRSLFLPESIVHTSLNAFLVSFVGLSTGTVLATIGAPTGSGSGSISGGISTNQIAYGVDINTIGGSNNLWFDGVNVGIGTLAPTQMLTVWGTSFIGNGVAVSYLNNAIFDSSTLNTPGQGFIGVYKYGNFWQGNGFAFNSLVQGTKVLGLVVNANTMYFGSATDNIDFLTLNSTQSNFLDNNSFNIFSINAQAGTIIQNSNIADQKALHVTKNDILNTASTTFVGISTITVPVNCMLTIEGMINGWATTLFNEAGTYFAVFYNTGSGAFQIGQTDIAAKFTGSSGNFEVIGIGNSVYIMVKSPSNTWFWRNHYRCFVTQNS